MKSSLSLLLPVHNAQTVLRDGVQRLLDVLPELTGRFELLIIDDGSTDATCEIAYELARDYPQVKVFQQATSLGWVGTVSKYAGRTTGEFLIIHCGGAVVANDIISLWRLRPEIDAETVKATVAQGGKSWRVDFDEVKANGESSGKIKFTTLLGRLCILARGPKSNVLLLKRKQLPRLEKSLAAIPRPIGLERASIKQARISPATKPSQENKWPSFLKQLKSFTLGE